MKEDVQIEVRYDTLFGSPDSGDLLKAAQVEANRGCARYDKQATYLSRQVVQSGNKYNGFTGVTRLIYTCD